jgi:hypothetical protein
MQSRASSSTSRPAKGGKFTNRKAHDLSTPQEDAAGIENLSMERRV